MRALLGTRRRIAVAALAMCAVALTSACAAGEHAATSEESPAIDGVGASVGPGSPILLREISIAPPPNGVSYSAGDSADLMLVIVNNGRSADSLTAVSTPAAGSVTVSPSATSSASATNSPCTSASATPSSSAASSTSATPTAGGSSSAAAVPFTPIDIQPGCRVSFGIADSNQVLVLQRLTSVLFPAALVNLTFTFGSAGSVTVPVPVQITNSASPTGEVVSDSVSTSSASE